MRWFSRKKSTSQDSSFRTPRNSRTFLYIIEVGDAEGTQTVSSQLMSQLVRATKEPALRTLDRQFGTESWCSEIRTNTSLQGPVVFFSLTLVLQPGETQASMSELVSRQFRHSWDVAAKRLLK